MLTKTDLNQIGKILKQVLKDYPTKNDLQKEISLTQDELKKEIRPIKKDIRKIQKDQKLIVDFFDQEYLRVRGAIKRLETWTKLPPLSG